MRWASLTCPTVLHTETSSLRWELTVASHHFERLENPDSRCFYSFDGGEPLLWRRHEALCTAPQSPVEGFPLFSTCQTSDFIRLSRHRETKRRAIRRAFSLALLTETSLLCFHLPPPPSPFLHPIVSSYTFHIYLLWAFPSSQTAPLEHTDWAELGSPR